MRMPNCELRHVVELVAPHRFRPAHAAGGGGGPTIHGAVWTATRMIGLDLPDDVFWTDVVRKVLCPWKRPSASLYFDCMHGVGHGGIMRATAVVKLRKLNKGSEPTALELLEYALGFCAASTNRHLAHDCSVGAYMGGYTDKAAAELVASGQLTAHFSAPCGQSGLRFTATCFQHVFYGMASKPGASAASDVCLNQLAEVDGLATEDLRIGCLVAQANIFFPRYDGYILERSSKVANTSNTRSRLTFCKGPAMSMACSSSTRRLRRATPVPMEPKNRRPFASIARASWERTTSMALTCPKILTLSSAAGGLRAWRAA